MLQTVGNLLGGVALLLFGMTLMTDGLRQASGGALRTILAVWTNNRLRGLLAGFLITGLVQSSSAVTVATIGFANAGMLTLEQAVWVIFGSNVGTTVTAWIVALIGFKIKIEALALPLIALGVLLKFTGSRNKTAAFGIAIIGFGLLFMGLDILKTGMESVGHDYTLPAIEVFSLPVALLFVGIGFLLTTLMQSSSAAMVVALGAAQSGLIPLNAAAALVIGANLGTTTTAILSVLNATSTARRVAVSHVFFNLITAIVAVFLLNPMLWLANYMEIRLGLPSTPALSLAVFHTVFNLLGVLLMWPLTSALLALLSKMFLSAEELESSPRHLDHTVLALPPIALEAMVLEVSRINDHCNRALQISVNPADFSNNSEKEQRIARKLALDVGKYGVEINREPLMPKYSEMLSSVLESTQQYLLAVDIAEDIMALKANIMGYKTLLEMPEFSSFQLSINSHLDRQNLTRPELNQSGSQTYDVVESTYKLLKLRILAKTSQGDFTMHDVDYLLQYCNQAKRGCRQVLKATQRLLIVKHQLQSGSPTMATVNDQTSRDASEPTQ